VSADRTCLLRCACMAAAATAALVWAIPAHASQWCGTTAFVDRTPNLIAGSPVRVAYVIPSDEPDRLAEVAATIQTDADTIGSWWRAQDQTRIVRFDLAPFSCGPQLDIVSIRLRQSGRTLAEESVASSAIVNALWLEPGWMFRKYLVYYDGPVTDPRLCGSGGNPVEGPGVAIVFLRACRPLVPSASVAAHELLHALGAVPPRAPHTCLLSAHTCDNEHDIMFPSAGGAELATLRLDPGRDDYYDHSGAWYDVRDSEWLVQLDGQVALSLTIDGFGTVDSDVPGLRCSGSCTTSWNRGVRLALTPRPATGMRFLRWNGACSGAATCRVTLEQAANVTATFVARTSRLGLGRRSDDGRRAPRASR
jgi:hypothetical protein